MWTQSEMKHTLAHFAYGFKCARLCMRFCTANEKEWKRKRAKGWSFVFGWTVLLLWHYNDLVLHHILNYYRFLHSQNRNWSDRFCRVDFTSHCDIYIYPWKSALKANRQSNLDFAFTLKSQAIFSIRNIWIAATTTKLLSDLRAEFLNQSVDRKMEKYKTKPQQVKRRKSN